MFDDDGRGKAEVLGSCVTRLEEVEAAGREGRSLGLRGEGGEAAGRLVVRACCL